MNARLNSMRAAAPAANGLPAYFTQELRLRVNEPVRYSSERSTMSYRNVRSRVPYASALYAAAIAALLSACSDSGVEPAGKPTSLQVSETVEAASDVPEVVITASREQPSAIG
jgi:hypothetical protein